MIKADSSKPYILLLEALFAAPDTIGVCEDQRERSRIGGRLPKKDNRTTTPVARDAGDGSEVTELMIHSLPQARCNG